MKKLIAALLFFAFGAGVSSNVSAASYTGHIANYFVSLPTNMPFRVYLDLETPDCPNRLFYVDFNSANYNAYVSGLLTAFSMQKTITISYTISSNGYCLISEYRVLA